MILLAIIIGFYSGYFLVEVYHDDILRKVNNAALALLSIIKGLAPEYDKASDKKYLEDLSSAWHRIDWAGHAWLSLMPGSFLWYFESLQGAVLWWQPLVILASCSCLVGSIRVLILNLVGNKVAGRKWNYLSSSGWEGNFEGINTVYYVLTLLLFIGSFLVLLLKLY